MSVSFGFRIRRHIGISLGLIAMSTGGAFAVDHYVIPTRYDTTALIMVVPGHQLSSLAEGTQFTATFAAMATSPRVLALTQKALSLPMSQTRIEENVVTRQIPNTDLFSVTATAPTPDSAAALANALCSGLQDELDVLVGTRIVTIAAPAIGALSHVSPNPLRAELLAGLLSLMAAVLLATIRDSLDTGTASEEEVEHWMRLDVLGTVPQFGSTRNQSRR